MSSHYWMISPHSCAILVNEYLWIIFFSCKLVVCQMWKTSILWWVWPGHVAINIGLYMTEHTSINILVCTAKTYTRCGVWQLHNCNSACFNYAKAIKVFKKFVTLHGCKSNSFQKWGILKTFLACEYRLAK